MFVDDDDGIREYLEALAGQYNLTCLSFSSGVEALRYLQEHVSDLPRGYVVDMRIPGSADELASSERIYEFLKARDAQGKFTYFTGCLSTYDVEVQRRTGANVLLKTQQLEELKQFLREVINLK